MLADGLDDIRSLTLQALAQCFANQLRVGFGQYLAQRGVGFQAYQLLVGIDGHQAEHILRMVEDFAIAAFTFGEGVQG